MRVKVRIDTLSEANAFVRITNTIEGKVMLTDGAGLCINAKSLLGVLYSIEFNELWCESDRDITSRLAPFIVND